MMLGLGQLVEQLISLFLNKERVVIRMEEKSLNHYKKLDPKKTSRQ